MQNYFNVSEFHKPGVYISSYTHNKLVHIIKALNPIREELGFPIIISKQSGYRPREYERAMGRSGKSEHCFEGKGAVDLTCRPDQLSRLFELLQESEFTRVCLYLDKGFIHVDFKGTKKRIFLCKEDNNWEQTYVKGLS